jgi:hypothetical protein
MEIVWGLGLEALCRWMDVWMEVEDETRKRKRDLQMGEEKEDQ